MIELKFSHISSFLGGGATYISQLMDQDNTSKARINEKLGELFLDMNDIMEKVKKARHPGEDAIKTAIENLEKTTKSIAEIAKSLNNN